MALGLEGFRQLGSGVFEREIRRNPQGQEGVRQSGLSRLVGRIQGWFRSPQEQQARVQERIQVKQAFLGLLEKTEGQAGALRALRACGLPRDWANNDRPLTNHQIGKILNKAQEYRLQVVRHNESLLGQTLRGLEGPELRDERAAVIRAVRNDSRYGNTPLSRTDVQSLRTRAETELRELRAGQCGERFPELTQLIQDAPKGSPLSRIELNPARLTEGLRQVYGGGPRHDPQVAQALEHLDRTTELLGRQAWNQDSLQGLSDELGHQRDDLGVCQGGLRDGMETLRNELDTLTEELNEVDRGLQEALVGSREAKTLQARKDALEGQIRFGNEKLSVSQALVHEMDRQIGLLDAKRGYVDEMRLTDPLTNRSVKHSDLIWAQAGNYLLDRLSEEARGGDPALTEEQLGALAQVRGQWTQLCEARSQAYRDSDDVSTLQPIEAPSKSNKDTHPIVQGKRDTMQDLRARLEGIGIPRNTLDALFSKSSMTRSERQALAGLETWQPVMRDMPVMRDGVIRTYKSEVVPAQFIGHELGVDLGEGRIGGVSAGVKDSEDHARNLKVSRLRDPDGQVMTTVVGHGVLDMWGVEGGNDRQTSNERGAREVLEVALTSNERLRGVLTDPERPQDAPPPRLVHVSVNLISPDSLRDNLGIRDYQERTYTQNQFRAFEANSGPGQTLRVFDPNNPAQRGEARTVNVDAITFSFGINAISTGGREMFMRVWNNVHKHNTANMIKLVGDLGEGGFGARGVRPGGFVGEVYDRLEAVVNDPGTPPGQLAKAEGLMAQLRGQTDLVRTLFTEESFRTGNGDTAKMGREILVLQGLAEQGLGLVGATDLAGTMSKGCKSDKDRGGVTDVELKAKLILRDLGGEMNPDERLQGDDQGVYYTVSSSSGQLENQRWNTGMGGSKEAGHLKDRLPDPEVRQFLCGLGKFAKA
ncbi:inositol phosphate phosphatase SopB [Castellaniella ginsengisoli]|uniref:Inositol phosphate phosphatase SopB n=1 Tax=Castellaniella ginsengisoli TaxID=546114 RepID=A0AB39GIN8_9BURK